MWPQTAGPRPVFASLKLIPLSPAYSCNIASITNYDQKPIFTPGHNENDVTA